MDRPVITFTTDFGPESAPAVCRGVMLSIARDAQIVDISHGVRKFAIRDAAYVVWSAVRWMPVATHLVVVDPGVGTERLPIAIRTVRGDALVGPDNGVLMPAAAALGGAVEARVLENRGLMLPETSATFHGRDIFAPMAAHLAMGTPFETVGRAIDPADLVQLAFPAPIATADGGLETEIIYVDSFGNARLAAAPEDVERAMGRLVPGRAFRLTLDGDAAAGLLVEEVPWGETFGARPVGAALLYRDSSGSLAIADNQGNAALRLGLRSGGRIRIHSPRS
jgi:S-adenosylmethionine hydrolase